MKTTKTDAAKLLKKNAQLNHLDSQKVTTHTQRLVDGWFLNVLLLDAYSVPFKYRRKKQYKSLKGARVNLTYYPQLEKISNLEFESMKVVRIRVS